MVNKAYAKKYCSEDISKIENYDKAIADTTQTWICHHRDEVKILPSGIKVIRTPNDLIEDGRYYKCPANELIFLTRSEHIRLHSKTLTGEHNPMYGRTHSDETCKKLSEAAKGKLNPMYGKTHSDESRRKISEAQKAYWAKRKEGGK